MYIHICKYTDIYTYAYAHAHMYLHTYVNTCVHTYTYIKQVYNLCMYVYICCIVYMHFSIYIYTCTYVYIHIYTAVAWKEGPVFCLHHTLASDVRFCASSYFREVSQVAACGASPYLVGSGTAAETAGLQ